MCGIHGIVDFTGAPVLPETLSRMGAITRHRGPDDEGSHVDGATGIGMRRLSIIDVAGGHQPLSNEDGSIWLVANGEIYNYRELARTLSAQGHHLRTKSDCETLLHLYEERGDDFLADVNGMFAFALWDARRRRLVLGRDRLGIKPLYVFNDGRRLIFASEAKAILAVPGIPTALDRDALASYLKLGYVAAPQSIFKGIRKL
ncbi:MAG TPA: asparagine synthetase B, partial [Casimicrobiaceae bacterium]|nr:asparagine synthetase B [Casimicrobiaceae bacterium]